MATPMTPFRSDTFLASPFRVDWITDLSVNEREDAERAVAEKCEAVLEAARFVSAMREAGGADVEVKVWLEAALTPAYVGVHYEPRLEKHYFLIMDGHANERLAAIVFDDVPSVTGEEVLAESRLFFDTVRRLMTGQEEVEMMAFLDTLQSEYKTMARAGAE